MRKDTDSDFWAETIRESVQDSQVADALIASLKEEMPFACKMAAKCPEQNGPDSDAHRKNLKRLHSQLTRLRDSVSSADGTMRADINTTWFRNRYDRTSLQEMTDKSSAGDLGVTLQLVEEWILCDPFKNLRVELEQILDMVQESIDSKSRGRGQPIHDGRLSVIKVVLYSFQVHAPEIEPSTKPSSLFYRVVNQYLDDVAENIDDDEIRDDNLVRTLRTAFPDS